MADAFLDYSRAVVREIPQAIDFEGIRAAHSVSSVVGAVIKLIKAGREFKACCPFHPDRSPSFYVNDDKGFYHCFGCGAHGDVLDFLSAYHGMTVAEAAEMLGRDMYEPAAASPAPRVLPEVSDRSDEAMAIWQASVPIEGTAAERYLRGRSITMALPPSLRFARLSLGKRPIMPAMVALVAGADGNPTGIQRTFLTECGRKADLPDGKVKFSLGRVAGGAVRLGEVCADVAVCEGVEDGLSLLQMGGPPVLAAAGAGMMKRMVLPSVVVSVIIGADADAAGGAAANDAAQTFAEQGKAARIIWPSPNFKDFNAELQGGVR